MDDYQGSSSVVYQLYTYMPYTDDQNQYAAKHTEEEEQKP